VLRLIGIATAVVAFVASAGASPVRPLVSTRLAIQTLAQDGNRIAWMSGGCYAVRIRSLATRRTTVVGNAEVTTCYTVERPLLALAGGRALWVVTEAGNNVYADVVTGTARSRNRPVEQVIGASGGSDGDYVTDVAGDGPTLVYSVISMSFLDTCIDPGTPCEYFVTGGRVMRVVGSSPHRIPRLPPALALAASGSRIALVAAAHDAPGGGAVPSGEVDVADAASGAVVARVAADGAPLDVALGASVLAVSAKTAPHKYAIEGFRADTGERLARLDVPARPDDLGVSGPLVLYRVGRVIHVFDAVSGDVRTVAVAKTAPRATSIEGRRVVWAERSHGRSRIVEAAAG
jgi:hypothetical protein